MSSSQKIGGSPQSIWKEQDMSIVTLTDSDIAGRANRLDRVVQRRNFVETFAGGIAVALLGGIGITELLAGGGPADMLMSGGFVLLALGIGLAVSVLYWRSRTPDVDPAESGLQFHRRRLVRERDMLGSAWLWYVGPSVPGFLLIYGAAFAVPGMNTVFLAVAGALTAALLVFIAVLNLRAARRIDDEIAALDENGR